MSLRSHVEMRKPFLVVAFALAFLLSAMVVSGFVSVAEANPYVYGGTAYSPLIISIASPQNNTVYTTNDIAVIFNVSTPERKGVSYLLNVYYTADWLPNDVIVYTRDVRSNGLTFTEHNADYLIPDGEHNLTIAAGGGGGILYGGGGFLGKWYSFEMTAVSVVNFTIDTTPPKISILSLGNKTYDVSDAPLDFALNEAVSQISFTLDGQTNVTVAGNTTLAGLPNGVHNVTVYTTDLAGNIGASETITFNIAKEQETLPTTVAAATIASVTTVAVGLTVYFKKRNHLSSKKQ